MVFYFFFFNDPAPTEIYTLSLHDALPISWCSVRHRDDAGARRGPAQERRRAGGDGLFGVGAFERGQTDRKSTRLNSSHVEISYAVFCLKKKKKKNILHNETIQKERLIDSI